MLSSTSSSSLLTSIWFNGNFLNQEKVGISILTYGLHYGYGVYEGVRFYNGKCFKLKEHIERFFASASLIGLEIPYTVGELVEYSQQLVDNNRMVNGYLRPIAWEATEKMRIGSVSHTSVAIIATERDIPYFSDLANKKPYRLITSKFRKAGADILPPQAKATGLYIMNSMYKKEAINAGYDDVLLLDYRGFIAESSTSNIFIIFDKEIHTPTTECFLNGITRQTVIEIAKNKGIKVVERNICLEELKEANGVFLTGTAMEITAVELIDKLVFASSQIVRELAKDYYDLVN